MKENSNKYYITYIIFYKHDNWKTKLTSANFYGAFKNLFELKIYFSFFWK